MCSKRLGTRIGNLDGSAAYFIVHEPQKLGCFSLELKKVLILSIGIPDPNGQIHCLAGRSPDLVVLLRLIQTQQSPSLHILAGRFQAIRHKVAQNTNESVPKTLANPEKPGRNDLRKSLQADRHGRVLGKVSR
jgi:hypothetical protein